MSSRRNQLQAAATKASSALKPNPQTTSKPSSSARRHIILVLVDVPDKSSLFANLARLLRVRCLVGVGNCWYPSDRIKLDDAPNTLEAASKSISALLEKMDKPCSVDIVLLIGKEEIPAPEDVIDLFSILDSALNQTMYHALLRIICLEHTRLNDWDMLLGASVIRVSTLDELNPNCFDDKAVVFRGSLILPGNRVIPGVVLSLRDDCNLADAKKCFGGSQQIKVLARVRLDSVPVILFRKSFRGEMHWNASQSVGHRMLSYWSRGLGIMHDDHGVFIQAIGGPAILLYCSNQRLYYRTIISIEEESKMVARPYLTNRGRSLSTLEADRHQTARRPTTILSRSVSASLQGSTMSSSRSLASLDASDLECTICSRLLLEPVTLSCGHTLCRSCLKSSLNVKRHCPFCRHPCSSNPISHPPTTLLVNLLDKYFPDESAARASEHIHERRVNQRRLLLFFTKSVEFPNRNVQYIIYEPRYQRMVSDCLASKREFVAVLDGKDVGCLMTIVDARVALDGRRLIQCRGLQPVQIADLQEVEMGFGLMSAAVTPIIDAPQSWANTADSLAVCRTEMNRLLEASHSTLARYYEMDNAVAPEGPSEFSYWAFGLVQCPESLKLAALAESHVGRRLQCLREAISESRRRIERRNWNQTLVFGAIVACTIAFSVKEHLSSK